MMQKNWVDRWSLVHFATGAAAAILGVPIKPAILAAVVYEITEQPILSSAAGQGFFGASGPEVLPNQILDVAFFYLGFKMFAR